MAGLRDPDRQADPRAAAGSMIALVVAGNQPIYPFYVHWLVGGAIGPVFATMLSTPGFLAVPLLARRHSLGARCLLPLVGIANTVWSAKLFGTASGVELFLPPCALIAVLILRPREWLAMAAIVAIAVLAFAGLHARTMTPLALYDAGQYTHFYRVNLYSAAMLTGCICLTLGRSALREARAQRSRCDAR